MRMNMKMRMSMKWEMKKVTALLLSLLLVLVSAVVPAEALPQTEEVAAGEAYAVGEKLAGFVVTESAPMEIYGAQVYLLEHEKTGAQLMYIANDDNARYFAIAYRTHPDNNKGIPHVFEHSALSGSKKYPSKELFFSLAYQTYTILIDAFTDSAMTVFPMGSLSEEQLLRYADYYLDSTLHPMVLEDKGIFDEEAWRYALTSPEDELNILGTVYTEMQGACNLQNMAQVNTREALFPGSFSVYEHGGLPSEILNMTWEELKEYHARYYTPSNTCSFLYGNIENLEAFLELMDSYFSAYDKVEVDHRDTMYHPVSEPVVKEYSYSVEAGSDTSCASVTIYAFACDDADFTERVQLKYLTELLTNDACVLKENVRKVLPYAMVSVYKEDLTPVPTIYFIAENINPEDAEVFQDAVDASIKQIIEDGFDQELLDAYVANNKMSVLLSNESSNKGISLIESLSVYWEFTGNPFAYNEALNNVFNLETWVEEGIFPELLKKFCLDSEHTARVTTTPVAGLKEKEAAALRAKLDQTKEEMSEEEISAIVESTNKPQEENADTAQYLKQLQAVTVENLPEEIRLYDISDETDDDGIRYLSTRTETTGIAMEAVFLDAGAFAQEKIPYIKLYQDLLGRQNTTHYTRAQIASRINRYLSSLAIKCEVPEVKEGQQIVPYMEASFNVLDEDVDMAFETLYEVLFETQFTDAKSVAGEVASLRSSLKQNLNNTPHSAQLSEAYARAKASYAYISAVSNVNYYSFLCDVEKKLAENPEEVLKDLRAVQETLKNRYGAMSVIVGNDQSIQANRAGLETFWNRLDSVPFEHVVYNFDTGARKEAIVMDSAVNYNLIYADYPALGLEKYSGDLNVLTNVVLDAYLYPMLRDQYGVYTIFHRFDETGCMLLTYRDSNIAETFDVYDGLPDFVTCLKSMDQSTLNGYILPKYAGLAISSGELTGGMKTILNYLSGRKQEDNLTYMRQLKALTPEKLVQYSDMYQKFVNDYLVLSTTGSAAAIEANADLYDNIRYPFSVDSGENE